MELTPPNPRSPSRKTTNNKVGHLPARHLSLYFYLQQPLCPHHPYIRGAQVIITWQAQKWKLGEPKSAAKVPSGKKQGRDVDPCGA